MNCEEYCVERIKDLEQQLKEKDTFIQKLDAAIVGLKKELGSKDAVLNLLPKYLAYYKGLDGKGAPYISGNSLFISPNDNDYEAFKPYVKKDEKEAD